MVSPSAPPSDLVDRLAAHRTLGRAPREQLEWLAAHAELVPFDAHAAVTPAGDIPLGLWIVLSGQLSIRVDRGAGPRKVMEWRAGDVTGVLPYSRMAGAPGAVRTETPSELLLVRREHFPALIQHCHDVVALLVHVMIDRARTFTSSDLQVEKMLSLGKLAAGLAHELNNPASAVDRAAGVLAQHLADAERAAEALALADLSLDDLARIGRARRMCSATAPGLADSPLARAEREDTLSDWLEDHGAEPQLAESLSDSAVTVEMLDELAATLDGPRLRAALDWMAAACSVRRLASEIAMAASRIHHLVDAVKGFTYMDQAAVPKPVDVGRGLSDTLVVLRAKARQRSATVNLEVAPGLPAVDGLGGELNQVWANLIDNALDAAGPSGRVDVTAGVEDSFVVVRVIDNGPGIPPAVRARIFDPFFTTKPLGVGTGLGLDIARRIVGNHGGALDFTSDPGRTEFRVTLPCAGRPADRPPAG
jgi:signal transduction histidine kinase